MNLNQTGFIDIHSHFLPGLDDGPENIDQCIETARRYREIGVTHIIATPHYIQGTKWGPSSEKIYAAIRKVERKLSSANISLHVLPGMEITLTDFLCKNFTSTDLRPLVETRYFLVECSLGATLEDPAIKGLQSLIDLDGCMFILAHPERYHLFQEDREQLRSLVAQGMLTQINIGSVIGISGKKAQEAAFDLFRTGLVHFLATDSHARENRMPPDHKQLQQLTTLLGEETVHAALKDNPLRLLEGKKIPPLQKEVAKTAMTSALPALDGLTKSFRKIFSRI